SLPDRQDRVPVGRPCDRAVDAHRLARAPDPAARHRGRAAPATLHLQQMSAGEKRWTLGLAAFATGLIAWLNGAATVHWGPLVAAVSAGKAGPALLAVGLAVFLLAMLAGVWLSWRKESAAYEARVLSIY